MTLTIDQFPSFYRAVNGYSPFPWQSELVRQVAGHNGLWPAVLDLPTSAGKTSAIDAAVFLLAMEAGKAVHTRAAAMRTFFVVDRRIVVDEAAMKARNLAGLLNVVDGKPDVVVRLQTIAREQRRVMQGQPDPLSASDIEMIRDVGARLCQFGGGKALHVSVLRGGMYRDGSWATSPTQPTICLSTVDQVGSRLLFRGYGVSPYQRAVHAGLVGNDALILVDEAHLSRPFIETLKAVEFYRSYPRWAEQEVKAPFQVVVMSATAGRAAQPIGSELKEAEKQRPPSLKLNPETDKNESVCPELHRRLTAKKFAKLVEATEAGFIPAIVEQAIALTEEQPAAPSARRRVKGSITVAAPDQPPKPVRVIGVVVNRVRTARRVAELLRDEYRKRHPLPEGQTDDVERPDVVLLTGRIRPYDRDELLFRRRFHNTANPDSPIRGLLPFVKARANEDRTDYERPAPPRGVLFVVATQTVEVGADFSFDALVTELAPLDALRQRFGRVDRLGLRRLSRAVIIHNKEADKDDPVYGKAPSETWKCLKGWEKASGGAKEIDFGIEATDARLPIDPEERATFLAPLCAPSVCAPVMMPAHVDDWVQTSVAPVPDPDPALFLHGPQAGPADVSVVWRADVTEALLRSSEDARKVVALVPPTSMEALPLPIWQVRRWLRDRTAMVDNFTDLEGEPEPEDGRQRERGRPDPFLIWKGPNRDHDTTVSRNPNDIRPGNTIVVPSAYGGCDEHGWCPESAKPVTDVADDCSWRSKWRPVVRVHPGSEHYQVAQAEADPETNAVDWDLVVVALLGLPERFGWLSSARLIQYPDGSGVIFVGRQRTPHPDDPTIGDTGEEAPADDEGNSFLGSAGYVPLCGHCRAVRDQANQFSEALGLSALFREVLSRAALLHDAGKADPRFQLWLYGSEVTAARNDFQLIAKSQVEARNAAAVEAARRRAGWPKGGRHEAASVLLIRDNQDADAGIHDPELLRYLVGAHHGRGRPLWPFTDDDIKPESPGTVPVALDGISLSGELPIRPEVPLARLDAEWVDLFWRLVRRYGYWGLAYLETLLVLADHRQSEAERNEERRRHERAAAARS